MKQEETQLHTRRLVCEFMHSLAGNKHINAQTHTQHIFKYLCTVIHILSFKNIS